MSHSELGRYDRQLVDFSANEHAVSVNFRDPNSHAATHMERHRASGFWRVAQEAVRQVAILRPDQAVQVEMGRDVGRMDLIAVTHDMERFYFQRPNRGPTWYPGVVQAEGPITSSVVVVTREMKWDDVFASNQCPHPNLDGLRDHPHSNLFSIYPGLKTPGVPDGDPKYVTDESSSFWQEYALRVDPGEVDTITVYMENGRLATPLAYKMTEQ